MTDKNSLVVQQEIQPFVSLLPFLYKYQWRSLRECGLSLWREKPSYMKTREYWDAFNADRRHLYMPYLEELAYWKDLLNNQGFDNIYVYPASYWITIHVKFPQSFIREYSVNPDWVIYHGTSVRNLIYKDNNTW